jgi:hypothetical protein
VQELEPSEQMRTEGRSHDGVLREQEALRYCLWCAFFSSLGVSRVRLSFSSFAACARLGFWLSRLLSSRLSFTVQFIFDYD